MTNEQYLSVCHQRDLVRPCTNYLYVATHNILLSFSTCDSASNLFCFLIAAIQYEMTLSAGTVSFS